MVFVINHAISTPVQCAFSDRSHIDPNHIERRKNKFKVDLVSFFISMLELKLELKLEVRLKVGVPMDQTPIRTTLALDK